MISDDIDCLARTVWGEARGCGAVGMRHVASVVINRVLHPRWWGRSVLGVCCQPWQFSCRNVGDPNLPLLLAVTPADPLFSEALAIARAAVSGQLVDETHGADSYYALSMRTPPAWAGSAVRTMTDAWHRFYRTITPQAPQRYGVTEPPDVPNVSLSEADRLNQMELDRLRGLAG